MKPDLPSRALLEVQAKWLADARARILRLAEIARRSRVLDLGSGYGIITQELRRRTSGTVIALDSNQRALSNLQPCLCARAEHLPFANATFNLVFTQNVLLWITEPKQVVDQVRRVLANGGVWVLFEPDFGGMIEFPPEFATSSLWITALKRAGADPFIGRKLPGLLTAGFKIRTELLPRLEPPQIERFDFLQELNLTQEERKQLEQVKHLARRNSCDGPVSHLPYFLIIAERK